MITFSQRLLAACDFFEANPGAWTQCELSNCTSGDPRAPNTNRWCALGRTIVDAVVDFVSDPQLASGLGVMPKVGEAVLRRPSVHADVLL